MEFLFSSFFGTLDASSRVWAAVAAALFSTTASDDLAAGFGSSLVFTEGAGSAAAAAGAGVDFLGSAAWKWCIVENLTAPLLHQQPFLEIKGFLLLLLLLYASKHHFAYGAQITKIKLN